MTTGEIFPTTPNPKDYWAQPQHAHEGRRSLGWLHQQEGRFVASLEPIADAFVGQEDILPSGWVELSPPSNYKQYGLDNPALAVHLVLDAQIKAKTDGRRFLGIIRPTNFESYGLQGSSMTVACGERADERTPSEYAPVAFAMPATYYSRNYRAKWLARLPADVLEKQAAEVIKAQIARDRAESLKERATSVELDARKVLLDKVIAAVVERTDPSKFEGWNRTDEVSDEALVMRALDTHGKGSYVGNVRNLAEVRERADAGLLPAWEGLFVAAAAVMSDDEMRELWPQG